MKRRGHTLEIGSEAFVEEFEDLPQGADLQVQVWKRRTPPNNSSFHIECAEVAAILRAGGKESADIEYVKRFAKSVTGHADLFPLPKPVAKIWGTPVGLNTRSVSFHTMHELEFNKLRRDWHRGFWEHIGPHLSDELSDRARMVMDIGNLKRNAA